MSYEQKPPRSAGGVIALLVLLLWPWAPARAELRIDITSGQVQPMPIAIPAFAGGGEECAGRPRHRRRRLGRSRTLGPVPAARSAQLHPERLGDRRSAPRFGDWRQINAQALVTGTVQTQADGRLGVEFRLWDVLRRAAAGRLRLYDDAARTGGASRTSSPTRSTSGSPARTAISTPASSMSPRSGPAQNRIKRLAIMDQDGANNHYLTDGRALVLTPRFSPTAQEITYLSYAGRHAARLSVQHRHRAAGSDRRLPRHDLCAAVFARRQPGRHEPRDQRRQQHLHARSAHATGRRA